MKTCEGCGKELIKRDNELESVFIKRRFCNRVCIQLPKRKEAQAKHDEIIANGFFDDLLMMSIKQTALKHNIPQSTAAWIIKVYNFDKQKARIEQTIRRNTEIRNKFKSGQTRSQLCGVYRLDRNTMNKILYGLEQKRPFELSIGMEHKSMGAIWDVEITVKAHPPKYGFYLTNTIWNT